jgi:hypothetical protein
MPPLTRSDAAALEHVLAVTGSAAPPFSACFLAAGVTTAAGFVSVAPTPVGVLSSLSKMMAVMPTLN